MDPAEAADRFAGLVRGEESELRLDEAALLIAAHGAPGLDVDAELARLDALAEGCPGPTLDHLLRHLFADLGFTGDRETYDDPRNSFLHEVVNRRKGLPITLSVLTMEVGRRVGVPVAGVGMPGHFLVRDRVDPDVFVDPFHGGALLDAAGCERLFRALHGPAAPFDASYLDPVRPTAILARMLANLANVYRAARARLALAEVLRLRASIPGTGAEDRAALAAVLASAGRFDRAADEWERLADELEAVDPAAAAAHRQAAVRSRARLN